MFKESDVKNVTIVSISPVSFILLNRQFLHLCTDLY